MKEYDDMVAAINKGLSENEHDLMVRQIRTHRLSEAEQDIIDEIQREKIKKKGIISVIPSNFSSGEFNFDRLMNQRARNPLQINKTAKFIAKGSFGVIFQTPGGVIKILEPDTNIDVIRSKANKIADITGDERQRVEAIRITKNDVPFNVLKEYKSLNSDFSFMRNNQPIPALSMPYLGVDLFTYIEKRPFALPEELYLDQCHKLLQQTYRLFRSGYSHGDIHSENIVFDGTEITIIDFDIFGTFKEVARTYEHYIRIWKPSMNISVTYENAIRSWTPPEFLILFNKLSNQSDTSKSKIAIAKDYITKLYKRSQTYFSSSGITLSSLRTLINESNTENLEYMSQHNISMIDVIPYVDNFGLGMALLELFDTLYYRTANPKLIKTRELLEKITQFKISERMPPDVAFAEMDKIHSISRGQRRFIGKTRLTYKNRPQGGTKRNTRRNKKNKQTRRRHK